ncbi:MAG: DNA polymerase III subunit gamma/tau, partial [Bacilli bacterium]|nr:DNA polymerase III subunit gamma/tau [Bacilli bacterium]
MYYALYRKYRPKNLNEIIGQEIIKNSLINSLNNNKISHAYLFSGPRGTGKTSIAKILARTVNCLEQSDGICCGKCNNCIESLNNSSPDIIEIDAASNNGVDEIREIRNKVNLVPTSMKYKIYIIDEVHMLTTGAFNALLKTLEEPPSHVIFILATTDLHKVPITILSRCQVFNFKRIETSKIADHLDYICKNEKITVDYTLLEKIADYSDGCMRDSIGLLEKLISYNSNKLSVVDFENILGVVNNDIIILLINNINNNNVLGTIDLVDKVYKNGKDINFFVQDIITFLRNTIISYYLGNNIDYPIEYLLLLTNKFLEINNVLKNSNNSKIALEIGIIEFINSSSLIIKPDNIDKTVIVQRSTDIVENVDLEDKNISREIKEDIVIVNKREEKEKNSYIENNDYFISSEKYEKYKFDIINNAFATANKVVLKELKEKLKE